MTRLYPLTRPQLARIRRIERQRAQLIATAGRLLAVLEATGWTETAWLQDETSAAYNYLRFAVEDAVTQDGES
jgi:hypothetical protein